MRKVVLSDAEAQLIWIIRTSKNFTVSVHADNGRWNATLEDHDSGVCGSGQGSHFTSAWDNIVDPRLRQDTRRPPPKRVKLPPPTVKPPPKPTAKPKQASGKLP